MNDKELISEALRWANGHPNRRSSELMRALADRLAALTTGRAEIAEQVRRHCTLPSEVLHAGSDAIVRAVADWIENPPEWVPPVAALTTPQEGDARQAVMDAIRSGRSVRQEWWTKAEDVSNAPSDDDFIADAFLAAFPVLSRTTSPDAATELRTLPENGCDEQAHVTMNRNINRVFENNVGLVNELDAMREERDAALAAIERVRALHKLGWQQEPYGNGPDGQVLEHAVSWCLHCDMASPCDTLAALDGAPEPETPELFPGTNAALDRLTVRKAADANAFCIEHGNFHAVELGDPTCEFEDGFGEPVGGEN